MIKQFKQFFVKEKNEEEIKSLSPVKKPKKQVNKKRKTNMSNPITRKEKRESVQLKQTRPSKHTSESNAVLNSIKKDIDEQSELIQESTFSIADVQKDIKIVLQNQDTFEINNRILFKRVDSYKNYLATSIRESKELIFQSIKDIKIPVAPVAPKIPQDYLKKDDFDFSITQNFNELKENMDTLDALEVLPKKIVDIDTKLDNLSQKIDDISINTESNKQGSIPKEEKSISDLAGFMRDGITQFENISKVSELENFENLKSSHHKSLKEMEAKSFDAGKKAGVIAFIKNFLEKTPSLVEEIQSEFLTKKYLVDEIVTINNENKNELSIYFNGAIEIGEYRVISCATLLDGRVVIKAELEKIEIIEKVETIQTTKKVEKVEKDG